MAIYDDLVSIFADDDDTGAAASKRNDTGETGESDFVSLHDELVSIFEEEAAEAGALKQPASTSNPGTGKTAAAAIPSNNPTGSQTLIACVGALTMATTESAQARILATLKRLEADSNTVASVVKEARQFRIENFGEPA